MADRKEFDIDGKPLSSLRVVDLKQELEKRGMSKSGSKKELSDRLKMQLQLEKLHESASTDEGHVPNLGLQDDEIAEHSDLIKDYLAKQQQIYEIQKEAIRRVELEDQRLRESSEASAGDTSQEEEEIESHLVKEADEPCAEDLSVPKSKKKERREKAGKAKAEDKERKEAVAQQKDEDVVSTECVIEKATSDQKQDSDVPVIESEPAFEEEKNTSVELTVAAQIVDDEPSIAVAQIEPAMNETPDADKQEQISINEEGISGDPPERESISETEENAAAIDSITLEVHIAPEDLVSLPESAVEMGVDKIPESASKSNEDAPEASKPLDSGSLPSKGESPVVQSPASDFQAVQMEVDTPKLPVESESTEKDSVAAEKPSLRHKIKLKRPKLSTSRSVPSEEREVVEAPKSQTEEEKLPVKSESPVDATVTPMEVNEEENVVEGIPDAKDGKSSSADVQSHRLSSEATESMKDRITDDSPKKQNEEKNKEAVPEVEDKQTSARKLSRSESQRSRRRRRSSSTESSSNESSSSSRSRPRYRSESSSSQSKSRSPSTSRDAVKDKPLVLQSEESMETNEDSVNRPFPKRGVGMDNEGEDKTADVDDSLSAADTPKIPELTKDSKDAVEKLPEKEYARITSRKISLSSSKNKKEDADGKENGTVDEEKPQRKRRWGGSSAVTAAVGKKLSLSISTDSLKGLIPDVKPLSALNSGLQEPISEPVIEKPMHVAKQNDSLPVAKDEQPTTPVTTTPTSAPANKRDLIIYRTVTQVVKDNTQTKFPEREISKGKLVVKNSAPINFNDDAGAVRRSPSPPRCPPSCIIHIRNLVRPFTDILLKELLSRTGKLVEGGFWMDKIKSKCYATFETEEQAVATRHALHGVQWPYSNPKRLSVDFATQDELEFHRGLSDNPDLKRVVPVGRNVDAPEKVQKSPPPSRRKEVAAPTAPAAPVGRQRKDSQRSERDKEKDKKEPKRGANRSQLDGKLERGPGGGRDREAERTRGRERGDAAGGQHQPPIREWDRDKIGEKSPGERARAARNRGRSPSSRSRSRSRLLRSPQPDGIGQGRDRNRDAITRDRRDRKDVRRKEEEEAPAKLLDDLFHKTKTTPCIYWLPLTIDQAKVREEERKQRQVEREKRRQMEQTTDRDRATGANAEPARRTRENDNSRIRKRSESPARSRTRRR